MIEVFGQNYYVDFDKIESYIDTIGDESLNLSGGTEMKINVVKYELIKLMLDVIFSEVEMGDNKLGLKSSEISIPFRLAFNSLLNKNIINHY
jgi:hypothetical protein